MDIWEAAERRGAAYHGIHLGQRPALFTPAEAHGLKKTGAHEGRRQWSVPRAVQGHSFEGGTGTDPRVNAVAGGKDRSKVKEPSNFMGKALPEGDMVAAISARSTRRGLEASVRSVGGFDSRPEIRRER